jgi:DNA-binding MarR family transcriptional regulator
VNYIAFLFTNLERINHFMNIFEEKTQPNQAANFTEDAIVSKENIRHLANDIMQNGRVVYERIVFLTDAVSSGSDAPHSQSKSLTLGQERMLLVVRRHGQMTLTRLAVDLNVTAPSASAMVDRLVEKGLLERSHSKHDRRKVVITATEEALDLIRTVENRILSFFEELVRKLGMDTARQWSDVLEQVRKVLK